MNFIQLAQRLRLECGVSGTGPVTVLGQSGEMERLVEWVRTADYELQLEHPDFDWMRTTVQFNTVAGQPTYTLTDIAITNHGKWKMDSFRSYETAIGTNSELFLGNIGYDQWRDQYQYNALRNVSNRPIAIAQAPDKSLCLGPKPDKIYTVVGEYWKTPTSMVADTDTPALPERYHMAIVYRAMMDYGAYETAPEVLQRGDLKYKEMLRRIEADQIPRVVLAGALA